MDINIQLFQGLFVYKILYSIISLIYHKEVKEKIFIMSKINQKSFERRRIIDLFKEVNKGPGYVLVYYVGPKNLTLHIYI